MGKTVVVSSRIVADKLAGFPPTVDQQLAAAAGDATDGRGGEHTVGGGASGGGGATAAGSAESAGSAPLSLIHLSTATLVVAPVSLLRQWAAELAKCTQEGLLSVSTYTMAEVETDRGTSKVARARRAERLQQLCTMDVVLTSYRALEADKHVLHKMRWRRICLDEMQEIRSSTTKLVSRSYQLQLLFTMINFDLIH